MADGRVLQLLGPSAGGIRRHVACLSDGLADRGWAVRTAGPAGVLEGLTEQDAVVDVSPALRPGPVTRARRQVAAVTADVDVVHAHGLKAGWLATTARGRVPVVVTVHNLVLHEAAGRTATVLRALEARLPRRAAATIAVSDQIADRFRSLPGGDRVVVVPPFAPAPRPDRDRDTVRRALGVGDDERLVVCAGRFHPQKDLPTLVRAFALLPGDVRLALVGGGPTEAEVRALISSLGLEKRVALPGYVPNAADELAAADVVALSSVWEGTPVALAEALRLDRPVAATAVGGVPDLVEDGVTGRLVPPRDPEALAAAIADLLADPDRAAAMARAGHERVEERLGAERWLPVVEDVYRRAIG